MVASAQRRALRAVPGAGVRVATPVTRLVVMTLLRHVRTGRLRIEFDRGGPLEFGTGPEPPVTMRIVNADFFRRVALRGRVGFAEAYMAGDFCTDDLPGLLALLARSVEAARERQPLRSVLAAARYAPTPPRRVTPGQQSRDIHYHYDLGNDFYSLFLDESMTYSCGLFEQAGMTLDQAQQAKHAAICAAIDLTRADHVLDIGCGWGSFAIHAAQRHGCRVTAVTVSDAQHAYTRRRVAALGLADNVEVVLADYRSLRGSYTRLVSIEMIEAIGDRQYDVFFRTAERLLARDGVAFIQTIAVPDQRFEAYRRRSDFIRSYIFPGGVLPSVEALVSAMTRSSRLVLHGLVEIGPHYVETLKAWRTRFLSRLDDVYALGFDQRFVRTWEYYLAFCEAGFRERLLRDMQLVLRRPGTSAVTGPGRGVHMPGGASPGVSRPY